MKSEIKSDSICSYSCFAAAGSTPKGGLPALEDATNIRQRLTQTTVSACRTGCAYFSRPASRKRLGWPFFGDS